MDYRPLLARRPISRKQMKHSFESNPKTYPVGTIFKIGVLNFLLKSIV